MAKKAVKKRAVFPSPKKSSAKSHAKTSAKKAAKKPPVKAKAKPSASDRRKPAPKRAARPVQPSPPVHEASPARLPVRKVIGRAAKPDQTVASVSPTAAEPRAPQTQTAASVAVQTVNVAVSTGVVPEGRKIAWDAIPRGVPAHIKFLMKSIAAECANAAAWPFPMGEFLANLPSRICAHEFACMLLSLEHDSARIAELCGIPESDAASLVALGTYHLMEYFSTTCPDMDRKWRAHSAGPGIGVEPLVDPHLVPKVDRNMQLVIGRLLLAALGAKKGGRNPAVRCTWQ